MTLSAQTFVSILVMLVVFGMIQGAIAWLILLERKVCAWIQDRVGPNRVGPAGLLQPIADGIKLFFKEDYNPSKVDFVLFLAAPLFVVVPALMGWVIIPWGGVWNCPGFSFGPLTVEPGAASVVGAALPIGIVYVLATGGVAVYGVVLGGWASNSKYAFLGGLRASAQMISYEIPMGVSLLIVLLMTGTLRADSIIAAQIPADWSLSHAWLLFAQPLPAIILFTSMLAEANRAPFDLAEAEQELVGGYHTEYSSMKWALFFFAEYAHMITASALFTLLFLGGWHLFPFLPQPADGGVLAVLLKFVVFVTKVALLITLMMVVRWTLPRFRYDQLMNLAWKILIPLSGVLLLGTALLVWKGYTQWWWMLALNALVALFTLALQPLLRRTNAGNRKVPLAGSRFSPAA